MFASPEKLPGRDALYLHRSVFNQDVGTLS
jgi:hypothetical protein